MLDYPKYSHSLCKGRSNFLTIIICNATTNISFLNQNFTLLSGNIILFRENVDYKIKDEFCDIFDYPQQFFDNLFYSQISDCQLLYDFLMIKKPKNEYLYFNYNNTQLPYKALPMLINAFTYKDHYQDKLLRMTLVYLFTQLDRFHFNGLDLSHSSMNRQHKFGAILGYMGEHYPTVTLNELAKVFNYNSDYLSYQFKKITGKTYSEKLLEIRIEQAKRYLINTTLKVEDIISLIGFKDKSFFMKKFKQDCGLTPLQYRKNYINKK